MTLPVEKSNIPSMKDLKAALAPFSRSNPTTAIRQLLITLLLYVALAWWRCFSACRLDIG